MEKRNFASIIDSSLLEPERTLEQLEELCRQARADGYAAVAVMPSRVRQAAGLLEGSGVRVCAAIGFPLGTTTPETKAFEAAQAIDNGALDVDMVMNIGALKDKDYELVYRDIRGVVDVSKAKSPDAVVKVVLETCLLTDEEKVKACEIVLKAGAVFVKTSTGFNAAGATVHDVELMYRAVGGRIGVKAAGRIRTYGDAVKLTEAGATRLGCGTGSAAAIVRGE